MREAPTREEYARLFGTQDDVLVGLTSLPPRMSWASLVQLPPWRAAMLARLACAAGVITQHQRDFIVREAVITGGDGTLKPWRLRTEKEKSDGVHAPWVPVRACRVCGCTDERGCPPVAGLSCWWIEPDLCSRCEGKADA